MYEEHPSFDPPADDAVLWRYESSHESAAVWRLYTGEQEGIAIKTDFQSLAKGFTCENDIFVGKVKYIDYDSASISDSNALAPFLYKRDSFEHEKEVRAINWDLPIPPPITLENYTPDFSTPLHEAGAYRQVDVSRLVHEVIVAPYADDWFVELVKSVAFRFGADSTSPQVFPSR